MNRLETAIIVCATRISIAQSSKDSGGHTKQLGRRKTTGHINPSAERIYAQTENPKREERVDTETGDPITREGSKAIEATGQRREVEPRDSRTRARLPRLGQAKAPPKTKKREEQQIRFDGAGDRAHGRRKRVVND